MADLRARTTDLTEPGPPPVVDIDDPRACDPERCGAKGSNLARAARAGLPVLPGFVVTAMPGGIPPEQLEPDREVELHGAWTALGGADRPLVVRSSSTVEDIGASSMAGQFRSVLDVRGWTGFLTALREVRESARQPGDTPARPMGVLVQPQLTAAVSGVMFGVDPVSGDDDRLVVEAVVGNPDALVSGRVTAQRLVLDRRGRVRSVDGATRHARHRAGRPDLLTSHDCRGLARLAAAAAAEFGAPQDVEWALGDDRRLWLLQSRPVTRTAAPATGPVLGPGPVAETFPSPLRPLECDLWLTPLREGISQALLVVGAVPRTHLATSPVVTEVGGWVAADLELFGYVPGRTRALAWIDPRPPARRLAAALRIGSVRASLADDVADALAAADTWLAATPPMRELSDDELLALCTGALPVLSRLHTLEVLAATLASSSPASVATAALRVLGQTPPGERSAAEVTRRHPVVLALTPPRVGTPWPLPVAPVAAPPRQTSAPGLRELARLRARWGQELQARAATELGRRLHAGGRLPEADAVAWLTLAELTATVAGTQAPADLAARMARPPGAPLPSHFRLGVDGHVIAVERPGARPSGGVGAGGGRGVGRVVHADSITPDAHADPGSRHQVLVVRDLDPTLAARLPGLAGLVSESGSTLSHLAILAREFDVPTVVAVHDAMHRFPLGSQLLVDGLTGEIRPIGDGEVAP